MKTRQQLYVCTACKSQQFHDVNTKVAPGRDCTTCNTPLVATSPSKVKALFKANAE